MLEKTTRMNFLIDFYQVLLTPKQKSYMSLYYLDDLSLGEIAEQFQVSRQAVYDNIKRTEAMLEEYEEKLNLFQKFQERGKLIDKLTTLLHQALKPEDESEIVQVLNEMKDLD